MLRRTTLFGSLSLACWAAAILDGCLSVRTPEAGAPVHVESGEGTVFGRVRVFELAGELTPWNVEATEIFAEDPVIRFTLLHVESGRKRPHVSITEEGRFEWILPKGTFLLYHTPSVDPPYNEGLAAFQVIPGADPVNLGELLLAISVDRPLSSSTATYSILNVEASAGNDRTDRAFLRNHPGTGSIRHGAFVVDPELGEVLSDWSREAFERILARHGSGMP